MTPSDRAAILEELGVDGLIDRLYPSPDPRRIALLRLNHAFENACHELEWVEQAIAALLVDPPAFAEQEAIETAGSLADKLEVLASELRKSLPQLREAPRAHREDPGSGRKTQTPASQRAAPNPSDWDDVPF